MPSSPREELSRSFAAVFALHQLLFLLVCACALWLRPNSLAAPKLLLSFFQLACFSLFFLWPSRFLERAPVGVSVAEALLFFVSILPPLALGAAVAGKEGAFARTTCLLLSDFVLLIGLFHWCGGSRARAMGLRAAGFILLVAAPLLMLAADAPARPLFFAWFRDPGSTLSALQLAALGGQILAGFALLRWRKLAILVLVPLLLASFGSTTVEAEGSLPRVSLEHPLGGLFRPGEATAVLVNVEATAPARGFLSVTCDRTSWSVHIQLPASGRRRLSVPLLLAADGSHPTLRFQAEGEAAAVELPADPSPRWRAISRDSLIVATLGADLPSWFGNHTPLRLKTLPWESDPNGWLLGGIDVLILSRKECRRLPGAIRAWVARGGVALSFGPGASELERLLGARVSWRPSPAPESKVFQAASILGLYLRLPSASDATAGFRQFLKAACAARRGARLWTWKQLRRRSRLLDPRPAFARRWLPLTGLTSLLGLFLVGFALLRRGPILRLLLCQSVTAGLFLIGLSLAIPASWAVAHRETVMLQRTGQSGAVEISLFRAEFPSRPASQSILNQSGLRAPLVSNRSGEISFRPDSVELVDEPAVSFQRRTVADMASEIVWERDREGILEVRHRGTSSFSACVVRDRRRWFFLGALRPGETARLEPGQGAELPRELKEIRDSALIKAILRHVASSTSTVFLGVSGQGSPARSIPGIAFEDHLELRLVLGEPEDAD